MKKLDEIQKNIEAILSSYLPKEEHHENAIGIEAARYSFLNGGKRLRPILMYAAYQLIAKEVEEDIIFPYMASIEMIHNYSLIHDDLPAMDNDALRRGKPTCHIVYGEANGILAGDILLNYAYETLFKTLTRQMHADVSNEKSRRLVYAASILGEYAGIHGMIGGQIADIAHEKDPKVSIETMRYIHEHKTSALIKACFEAGCILAGGTKDDQEKFSQIGNALGLAFQIQDDILDCNSTQEVLGKPIGSDEKNGKMTYVSFYGMDEATKQVEKLFEQINQTIEEYDPHHESMLAEVIEYIQNRNH